MKGLIIIGGEDNKHPSKVRLWVYTHPEIYIFISYRYLSLDILFIRFKNRPHMTFDDVAAPADQEFNLIQDYTGTTEYATK